MDRKVIWDNIQDSSRIVLSIVTLFVPPEIKIAAGLSSVAVGIVNRVLKNTKLLDAKDNIDAIADSQLNKAIEKSMRNTYKDINTDIAKKLMLYMEQRIANKFSYADASTYESLVNTAADDMDKFDALYVDKKTISEISALFLSKLRVEIKDTKNQQLFNLIVDERLSNLENLNLIFSQKHDAKPFEISKFFNFSTKSYFYGRNEEQRLLRKRVDKGIAHIVLWGLGGIGKTEICKKLYQFYVTAQEENLPINIDRIAYFKYNDNINLTLVRQLKYDKPTNAEKHIEYAWDSLIDACSSQRVLIFIDNVDKSPKDDPALYRLNELNASIIMTTRIKDYPDFETVKIFPMDYEINRQIFLSILSNSDITIKEDEESVLLDIIKNLVKNHISTTIFLAKTLVNCCWSIHKLHETLNLCGFNIPDEARNTDISNELSKLFPLTGLSPSEINILEAFALMPNIELNAQMCSDWMLQDANIAINEWKFSELSNKGWLEQSGYNYLIHPIIAASIRLNREIIFDCHRNLYQRCFEGLLWDSVSNISHISEALVYALSIATYMNDINTDFALGFKLGITLIDFADYQTAVYWLTKSYSASLVFGKTEITNEIYRKLADSLLLSGKTEIALDLLMNAYKTMPTNTKVMISNSLAIAMRNMWTKDRKSLYLINAIEILNWAIEVTEKINGHENDNYINLIGTLANIYCLIDLIEEARELHKKSMIIRENIYGYDHPKIGFAFFNIGAFHYAAKDYVKAKNVSIKALQILIKTYPAEHKYVRDILTNLATFYDSLDEKLPELETLIKLSISDNDLF